MDEQQARRIETERGETRAIDAARLDRGRFLPYPDHMLTTGTAIRVRARAHHAKAGTVHPRHQRREG